MKLHFLKTKRWLLIALLGIIGAVSASCEKYGSPENEFINMYGCPPSDYNDSIQIR